MKKAAVILALVLCPPAVLPQAKTPTQSSADHHDRKPEDIFRLKPLSGNVYALYGRGGNVGFFVGPDAVAVIDSQFKDIAPGIVAEIKKVTDRPIKFLIKTHHHGDHVGGNEFFRAFAMILAHDNVRTRMLADPANILRDYPGRLEEAKKAGNRVIPFIDIAGGGPVRGYLAALDKVISRVPADVTVIPGHGDVTDLSGLNVFRQYIADLLDVAQKAKAAGRSKEDFVQEVDLPTYKDYSGYKDRFKANAASAYDQVR